MDGRRRRHRHRLPDRSSSAPHAAEASLSPKFRTARCAEIGLALERGIWVPWTTPVRPGPGTWIDVGITLFDLLLACGHGPIEVYPHGAFRVLNDGRPPPGKQTLLGARSRVTLLRQAGVSASHLAAWGHDALDAAAAALVALHRSEGRAQPVTCGHDGSAIWLPAPGPAPAASPQRPV